MADPWRVHTLVFDLDDTLYPERDYALEGFAAVGAWLERKHRIAGFADRAALLFREGRRGRIFDETLAGLGQRPAPDFVATMVDVYRRHEPRIELCADAHEILDWAAGRFRLALITDGYLEVQRRKIEALKLERWMSEIICSDQWGRENWKPASRPYQELMRRTGGTAGGFLYVGDNPHKDFIGARAMGWRTVRVRRTGGEHVAYEAAPEEAAQAEVPSLSELKSLVVPWA